MFAEEYNALFVENHEDEKNQPCPPELARTKVLIVDGIECKVYYNYVPPYGFGAIPMNCWWGLASGEHCQWRCPLAEGVKTLEEACDIILPAFTIAVKRWKDKQRESVQD